jgi:hypothetical protein
VRLLRASTFEGGDDAPSLVRHANNYEVWRRLRQHSGRRLLVSPTKG